MQGVKSSQTKPAAPAKRDSRPFLAAGMGNSQANRGASSDRGFTEGLEPEELSDENLRAVISAIERGLPSVDG